MALICGFAHSHGAPAVIASSGFNDQSGLHSNPTANSPFQIGVTVHNQGAGEPGWDAPWARLGGFDDRAPVTSEFVHEGDGSVKLFADNVFGTAIERPWFEIVPTVRIDAYILVRPAASMRGNATFTTEGGEIPPRTAAYWEIQSGGNIRVFDKATNQPVSTGFTTLPNVWNKYSLIIDAPSQTWTFLFNDRAFPSPQTLAFLNTTIFVDRVNLQAQGTLNSYVDSVTISAVPIAADFDEDNDVDAADLAAWQSGFGMNEAAAHIHGDANYDQDVDGGDFLVWQRQLGAMTPAGTVAAVPEPATASILVISLVAAAIRGACTDGLVLPGR
jgi:hypothetical protein